MKINPLDIFDNEEQLVLNRLAMKESKNSFIERLEFGLSVGNNEDIADLLKNLKSKVSSLSDEEWGNIEELLPFDVPCEEEDEVDF